MPVVGRLVSKAKRRRATARPWKGGTTAHFKNALVEASAEKNRQCLAAAESWRRQQAAVGVEELATLAKTQFEKKKLLRAQAAAA